MSATQGGASGTMLPPITPPQTPTPAEGLSARVASDLRKQGLGNVRPPASGRSVGQIVRANVFTRINAILATLLVIVLSTGSWTNGLFGLLIICNSGIGIIQEIRAKRMLDKLAVVGESRPRIRRAGEPTTEHSPAELVRGDLVEISRGDQVVVDGVLAEGQALEMDEALLTGESDPVVKQPGDPVWSGSNVVAGSGCYQAVRVGADSYASRLTAEASKFSLTHSVLMQGINKILRVITWLLVPVALLTIYNGLRQAERGWREAVLGMAGALVPMVPEGLVLLTSMAFAVGVVRLGRRQCLVQELPAIEGLARVDIVCADKTGTLTENLLVLTEVVPLGEHSVDQLAPVLVTLASADPGENPSMQAIREHFAGIDKLPITDIIAFTSAKKYSAVRVEARVLPGGTTPLGPPELRTGSDVVASDDGSDRASRVLPGGTTPLGPPELRTGYWAIGAPDVLASGEVAARAQELGATGLRVLLAGPATLGHEDAPPTVEPAALIVLEQKVRPDASATVDYFAQQGVAVKVISGDNAVSVGAVATSVGLAVGTPIDARTLPPPGPEFDTIAEESTVFGRVSPEQKRHLVQSLKAGGHGVAMTGDGVNDVLALKDADIGVAMGSGSAAARGVAQIVLLDNKFATLPHVVAEGRRVIGNIERVANLFLTKTVYSVALALMVGLLGFSGLASERFPFVPIHVTMIGWFTIGIPAAILALAPNHERARPGFVHRVLRLAMPSGLIVALCAVATWWWAQPAAEAPEHQWTQASTAALVTLLVVASWVLAVVARPYAWWKIVLLAASMGCYVVIFLVTPLHRWLFLNTGNPGQLVVALLVGLLGAACVEAMWWINRADEQRLARRAAASRDHAAG